jgi:hypothetical protein
MLEKREKWKELRKMDSKKAKLMQKGKKEKMARKN